MPDWGTKPVVLDFFGNELGPGDTFAYASPQGRGQQQLIYRFIKRVRVNSNDDYESPWRVEADLVLPEKEAGWATRPSLLHADLFMFRAIKVSLPSTEEMETISVAVKS